MPTVADRPVPALRRLELILDAIRVLEADRPFGDRVEDALRLAVGTRVVHSCGVLFVSAEYTFQYQFSRLRRARRTVIPLLLFPDVDHVVPR